MLAGLLLLVKLIHFRIMPIILVTNFISTKMKSIVMYGVTHVAAVDGFSGIVVGFVSMPVKNNVEIYDNLYQ